MEKWQKNALIATLILTIVNTFVIIFMYFRIGETVTDLLFKNTDRMVEINRLTERIEKFEAKTK